MAQPLDAQLARDLAPKGIKVVRDGPHRHDDLRHVDRRLGQAVRAADKQDKPDAVVMFMGANEGFPMKVGGREVKCCGADWAAEYAYRRAA
jgi:hypothetical protein